MFVKFMKILFVFYCYVLVTDGEEGVVPYQSCPYNLSATFTYNTNSSLNDSLFIDAKTFTSQLWYSTSVQSKCDDSVLTVQTRRTITRQPENSQTLVLYHVIIDVKELHRYNKTLFKCLLELHSLNCYHEIQKSMAQTSRWFNLTLNVSGRPLRPSLLQRKDGLCPDVDLKPQCPSRSIDTNNTCVCERGTYLDVNVSTCLPCPRHSYQEKQRQINCTRCSNDTITISTSSSSVENCITNCGNGSYYDTTTKICRACPKDTYQHLSGTLQCTPCPKGKGTASTGSRSLSDCQKKANCGNGSYYDTSTKMCRACPKDTYQHLPGTLQCTPCPKGNGTASTGSRSLSDCQKKANCSNGSYYDTSTTMCMPCPEDTYQHLPGKLQCTSCPDEQVTSSTGSRSLSDCHKKPSNVLAIVLSVVAVVVLAVLVLAGLAKFFIDRRKRNAILESFKKNFQVFENPYAKEEVGDEERDAECCTTLGDLEEEVLRKDLEIPRDCIKLTGVRLGRGNFGEVHQVLVKKNDEPEILCAAKMARGGSQVTIQDMLEELDTHLKLDKNPNVVNLLGVCSSDDGPFYLLMEYCDKGCLSTFLKDNKEMPGYVNTAERQPLALEWRLQRAMEICNGMKFLAQQKIVHRDLAARNILLDCNMVAKVSDFGMAKDVYVKSYYRQRHEGSFPLRWMAIESIEDLSFTEKTDVWSFGVLLWEIWTDGKRPYYFIIDDEKVAQFILTGKKLKRPPKCPKSLYRIILKCWNDKDYNRPKFRELHEELRLYTNNEQRQNSDGIRTAVGTFKKRFNETKRSFSRKLSRERASTSCSQMTSSQMTAIDVRSSRSQRRSNRRHEKEPQDNIGKPSFEVDDVVKSSGTNDESSREESDGNSAVIPIHEQGKEILSDDDDEKGKNLDGINIPEACLEDDIHEPNVLGHTGENEQVMNDDPINIPEACLEDAIHEPNVLGHTKENEQLLNDDPINIPEHTCSDDSHELNEPILSSELKEN